jgi:hypothetical protein
LHDSGRLLGATSRDPDLFDVKDTNPSMRKWKVLNNHIDVELLNPDPDDVGENTYLPS